jgi:hypothetical protein
MPWIVSKVVTMGWRSPIVRACCRLLLMRKTLVVVGGWVHLRATWRHRRGAIEEHAELVDTRLKVFDLLRLRDRFGLGALVARLQGCQTHRRVVARLGDRSVVTSHAGGWVLTPCSLYRHGPSGHWSGSSVVGGGHLVVLFHRFTTLLGVFEEAVEDARLLTQVSTVDQYHGQRKLSLLESCMVPLRPTVIMPLTPVSGLVLYFCQAESTFEPGVWVCRQERL